MNRLAAALCTAVAIVASAFPAAASVELSPPLKPTPIIDIPFAMADYFEIGGAGNIEIAFAEGLATGVTPSGPLFLDIFVDYDVADPLGTIDGALFATDDAGSFLDGLLVEAGYVPDADIIQLLFGGLTGSAAGRFGPFALVEVFFVDPLGTTDPFAGLVDGSSYDIAGTVQATVPLPAPALLLAAALAGLVGGRRCLAG